MVQKTKARQRNMDKKIFPKSLSSSDVSRCADRARAPSGDDILVAVVEDESEDRTARKLAPPEAQVWTDETEASRDKYDSDPSVANLHDNLHDTALDLAMANTDEHPALSEDETGHPVTKKETGLVLAKAELRAVKRTLRHAVRRDPELSQYFAEKCFKYGVPEDRACLLSVFLGIAVLPD